LAVEMLTWRNDSTASHRLEVTNPIVHNVSQVNN
jgi:hypothetical protein